MNKLLAQKRLAKLWFINAALVGAFFVILTNINRFGTRDSEVWEWYGTYIAPFLTLMFGSFMANINVEDKGVIVDEFYFKFVYYISIFYFLIVYIVIFMVPISSSISGISFVDLLLKSKVFFKILLSVTTLGIGLFFTQEKKPAHIKKGDQAII